MNGENKKTILLVEDEVILAMTQKMTLENYGYNAIIVKSGEEAVEIINNTPDIQLILMDIDLGKGIDGAEAAALILKDHDIPVVFCSSHTEAYIVEKTEKITSYGYIVKSSSNTVLDASIKMAFKLFEANAKTLESEEQYSAAFNTSPYGITITSPKDGRFIKVNKAFTSITGYSHDEALIDSSINMGLWVNVEDRNRVVQELMSGNNVFDQEFLFKKKTGETMTGLFSASLIKIKNERFVLSSINDITERKQMEKALRINESKLNEILNTINDGVWSISWPDMKMLYLSPAIESLYGYSTEEIIEKPGLWKDVVHPEDRLSIENTINELLATGSSISERRIIRKDGEVIWVQDKSHLIYANGKPLKIVGVISDITERKLMEEMLAESELIFNQFMINSPMLIYIKDEKHRLLKISKNMETLLGKPSNELIGKDSYDFLPPEFAKSSIADDMKVLKENKLVEAEEELNDRVYLTIKFPIHVGNGQQTYLAGFSSDITERKKAEKKLERILSDLMATMVNIVELRDPYTAGHQNRVAKLSKAIAVKMRLTNEMIENIYLTSLIHDIGKIYVPAEILSKPSKLSKIEFSLIKEHAQHGYNLVKNIDFPEVIGLGIYQHHERLDGSGYPNGLKGSDIILEAKIICVADVVEAMASHRPYRPALGIDIALEELVVNSGKYYDPNVVEACKEIFTIDTFKFD